MRSLLRCIGRELGCWGRGLAVALLCLAMAGAGPLPAHACEPDGTCAGSCAEAPATLATEPSCCDRVASPPGAGAEPAAVPGAGCACTVDAAARPAPAVVSATGAQLLPMELGAVASAVEGDPARAGACPGAPCEARPRSPGTPLFLASAALLI